MKILTISFSDAVTNGTAARILHLAYGLTGNVALLFDNVTYQPPQCFRHLTIRFTPDLKWKPLTLVMGIFAKLLHGLQFRPLLVHCFKPLPTSYIPAYLISRISGAKLLVDFDDLEDDEGLARHHGLWLRGLLKYFQRLALKSADGVVVATSALAQVAGKFNPRVFHIANGAPLEWYDQDQETSNAGQVLYIGSLYKTCDLDLAIKALVHAPSAHLVVAGDGLYRPMYEKLAAEQRLDNRVTFLGLVPSAEIPQLIRSSKVVLLPMRDISANRCRSPIKLGEYMGAGGALVASPVGIVNDLIEHGKNGLLAESVEEFGRAIELLLNDEELRRSLGREAHKTAVEKLSWDKLSKALEGVYAEFITDISAPQPIKV